MAAQVDGGGEVAAVDELARDAVPHPGVRGEPVDEHERHRAGARRRGLPRVDGQLHARGDGDALRVHRMSIAEAAPHTAVPDGVSPRRGRAAAGTGTRRRCSPSCRPRSRVHRLAAAGSRRTARSPCRTPARGVGRAVEQAEQGVRVVAGPGPWSRTATSTASPAGVASTVTGPSAPAYLAALLSRLWRTWRSAVGSATTAGSDAGTWTSNSTSGTAGGCRRRLAIACWSIRLGRQPEQAAVDARQHQQVVGDPPQPLGLLVDVGEELRDVRAVRVAGEDGRGAVDAGDRRPQLVGHDREERLGGLAASPLALQLQPPGRAPGRTRRHVAVGPDQADRPPVRVGHRPGP